MSSQDEERLTAIREREEAAKPGPLTEEHEAGIRKLFFDYVYDGPEVETEWSLLERTKKYPGDEREYRYYVIATEDGIPYAMDVNPNVGRFCAAMLNNFPQFVAALDTARADVYVRDQRIQVLERALSDLLIGENHGEAEDILAEPLPTTADYLTRVKDLNAAREREARLRAACQEVVDVWDNPRFDGSYGAVEQCRQALLADSSDAEEK